MNPLLPLEEVEDFCHCSSVNLTLDIGGQTPQFDHLETNGVIDAPHFPLAPSAWFGVKSQQIVFIEIILDNISSTL